MPEIIECEKEVEDLLLLWVGRSIKTICPIGDIQPSKFFGEEAWADFWNHIKDQKVLEVTRHAKFIQIYFESRWSMWVHFSSTGWLMQTDAADGLKQRPYTFLHSVAEPSHRFSIQLSDGQKWVYSDSRTWGKFYVQKGRRALPNVKEYGPDWLKDPDGASMNLMMYRGNRIIKVVLCDQHTTAGVGNYLACEACFVAGINPHQRWKTLEPEQISRLSMAVIQVLKEAQENDGHDHWGVFQREGKPCVNSNEASKAFHVVKYAKDPGGQRGSYFCTICQGDSPTFQLRKRPDAPE